MGKIYMKMWDPSNYERDNMRCFRMKFDEHEDPPSYKFSYM